MDVQRGVCVRVLSQPAIHAALQRVRGGRTQVGKAHEAREQIDGVADCQLIAQGEGFR
jgi:hypothetical protein